MLETVKAKNLYVVGKHPTVSDFIKVGRANATLLRLSRWVESSYDRMGIEGGGVLTMDEAFSAYTFDGQKRLNISKIYPSYDKLGRAYIFMISSSVEIDQNQGNFYYLVATYDELFGAYDAIYQKGEFTESEIDFAVDKNEVYRTVKKIYPNAVTLERRGKLRAIREELNFSVFKDFCIKNIRI